MSAGCSPGRTPPGRSTRRCAVSAERPLAARQQRERALRARGKDVVAALAYEDEFVDAVVDRVGDRGVLQLGGARVHRLAGLDEILERALYRDEVHAGLVAVDRVEVAAQEQRA